VPARSVEFGVLAHKRRRIGTLPVDIRDLRGRARTRFRVTLRGRRIRWVTVVAASLADPRRHAETRVRVR
jgi:hypothetical protein